MQLSHKDFVLSYAALVQHKTTFFFPTFIQSTSFYITLKHTLILTDDKSIINVSQVNVITEGLVIFFFMNLHKPLKMFALISFKMLFRIILCLLQIVTSR